jgi:hypothetical protein
MYDFNGVTFRMAEILINQPKPFLKDLVPTHTSLQDRNINLFHIDPTSRFRATARLWLPNVESERPAALEYSPFVRRLIQVSCHLFVWFKALNTKHTQTHTENLINLFSFEEKYCAKISPYLSCALVSKDSIVYTVFLCGLTYRISI